MCLVNPVEYLISSKVIHPQGRIHTMSYTKYDAIELLHGVNPVEGMFVDKPSLLTIII
jgi:hypothetical protein